MKQCESQSRIQESFPILNKWCKSLRSCHICLSKCVRTWCADFSYMNEPIWALNICEWDCNYLNAWRHPFHLRKNFRVPYQCSFINRKLLLPPDEITPKYLPLIYLSILLLIEQILVESQSIQKMWKRLWVNRFHISHTSPTFRSLIFSCGVVSLPFSRSRPPARSTSLQHFVMFSSVL